MSNERRTERRTVWLYRLVVWGILTVIVLVFFRAWIGSGLPASPRREVLAHFSFIWQIARQLRAGDLYLDWDPSYFAGYAWMRFLQYPVYYIPAAMSLLPGVSLASALKVFIMLTYVLSGWAMSELVHTLVRKRARDEAQAWGAALAAGAAYAIFPFHIRLGLEIIHHAAFWAALPLPFLVYELRRNADPSEGSAAPGDSASHRSTTSAILLGFCLALFALIDSEHAVICTPFVVLYILMREAARLRLQWRRTAAMLLVAAAVALGLTAFYVLPAVAELSQVGISARFGSDNAQFQQDSGVSPGALLAGALNRAGVKYQRSDLPDIVFGFFGANSWYLGLVTVALAALGLTALRRSQAAAVALVLLLLAFSWAARAWLPLNLFRAIPFFGALSGFRGMMLIGFFLCLLAGFGALWLFSRPKRAVALITLALLSLCVLLLDRPRPTPAFLAEAAGVLALLALVLVAARRKGLGFTVLATLLLISLVMIDYRTASSAVVSLARYLEPDETDAYRWLASQGNGYRIWDFSNVYTDAEFVETTSLAENQTPRFGGYFDNGAPQAQWKLYKWAKPESGVSQPGEELRTALKLSSVRYVLIHTRLDGYQQALQQMKQLGFDNIVWQSPNVTILEDPAWQPLANLYAQVLPVAGGTDSEIAALPEAQAAQNAVVGAGNEGGLPASGGVAAQNAAVLRTDPGHIAVRTDSKAPGLLVLSESWYPGWRVSVDGRAAELLRANAAFMGVRLDAGEHDVLYFYRPSPVLYIGWGVTVLTWAVLAVWWFAHSRRPPEQG